MTVAFAFIGMVLPMIGFVLVKNLLEEKFS